MGESEATMKIRSLHRMTATAALVLLSALALTGQEPNKEQTVKPIGKAPSLADDQPKKDNSTPVKPPAAGAAFSEGFAGSKLPADWKLMNPDEQRWTLQPNKKSLLIITQNGLLTDSKNLKNYLLLNRELPADDFELIVEESLQIQGAGNYAGIALFSDDQNYYWLDFQGDPWGGNIARTPYFCKIFQGKATNFEGERKFGHAEHPEHIFLKIEREGNQFSGSYAFADKPMGVDEVPWVKLGTLPWINFHGKLMLAAANFQDGPEVSAEFYSVLIRKKQAGDQSAVH